LNDTSFLLLREGIYMWMCTCGPHELYDFEISLLEILFLRLRRFICTYQLLCAS